MKFSACCTTQSKAGRTCLFSGLLLAILVVGARAQNGASEEVVSPDSMELAPLVSAVAANRLQEPGNPPFHLKSTFQIYDLEGKPGEEGSIDYWWAGADGFALTIKAPSIGEVHNTRLGEVADDNGRRSLYLANELLDALRVPYGAPPTKGTLVSQVVDEGKLTLTCMHVESPTAPASTPSYRKVCVDDTSGTIRLITEPTVNIARNRTGKFGETKVALDVRIDLAGREAVTGHVESLQGFNPKTSPVVLQIPATSPADTAKLKAVSVSQTALAKALVNKVNPMYPLVARQQHVSGSVILHARVTETGTTSDLFPIATADPILTAAAVDAAKQWMYKPYLLNGRPVAVETVITMNFSLSR